MLERGDSRSSSTLRCRPQGKHTMDSEIKFKTTITRSIPIRNAVYQRSSPRDSIGTRSRFWVNSGNVPYGPPEIDSIGWLLGRENCWLCDWTSAGWFTALHPDISSPAPCAFLSAGLSAVSLSRIRNSVASICTHCSQSTDINCCRGKTSHTWLFPTRYVRNLCIISRLSPAIVIMLIIRTLLDLELSRTISVIWPFVRLVLLPEIFASRSADKPMIAVSSVTQCNQVYY